MNADLRPLAIAVIIPVHDEQALLPECLRSVHAAAATTRRRGIRTDIWIALDACADGSADIARRAGVNMVELDARRVGAARQAGVEAALGAFATLPLQRVWTAHTDADSVVPRNWLARQFRFAAQGADAVIGTVRPDFGDLSPEQRAAWKRTHTRGAAIGHVHGANLGIRASALMDAGGFRPVSVSEDVLLIESARSQGARIDATVAIPVRTSGRQFGRAPDGYARYLREDLVRLAEASRASKMRA